VAERILVLGGTRSGKSQTAERLVADEPAVTYIATGAADDAEMDQRVAAHRARRPAHWHTVESHDVEAAIRAAPAKAAVLIDALAGWVARRMTVHGLWPAVEAELAPLSAADEQALDGICDEARRLWTAAAQHPGSRVVVVADESGLGLVPAEPSGRRWLDVAGGVAETLAAGADRVLLCVAGRAVELSELAELTDRHPALADEDGERVSRLHGDTMVPDGALDFATNVYGDRPPDHIQPVLAVTAEQSASYPDDTAARTALAVRHGRAPEEVVPTAGAAAALWLAVQAATPRLAVCVHPGFTEPEAALRAAGAKLRRIHRRPHNGWALQPEAVPDEADFVVVGNPTNPTGTLDAAETVAALCRPGRVTLVDEAFMDFVADEADSLAARADLPGLVVVRSVTKLWGLAGVRAGYLLAEPSFTAACERTRPPWTVGAQALAALEACADDEAYRRRVAGDVAAARAGLVAELGALPGVEVWPAHANFCLLRVADGEAVRSRLVEAGVAVRPATFPGLDGDYLRVAVRELKANEALVAALAKAVEATG
jgi:histidinol-phosphate aminotransferase